MNKTMKTMSCVAALSIIPYVSCKLYKKYKKEDEMDLQVFYKMPETSSLSVHCVNDITKIYHSLNCNHIKITDNVVHKDTKTLRNEGYKPCPFCNPDIY